MTEKPASSPYNKHHLKMHSAQVFREQHLELQLQNYLYPFQMYSAAFSKSIE